MVKGRGKKNPAIGKTGKGKRKGSELLTTRGPGREGRSQGGGGYWGGKRGKIPVGKYKTSEAHRERGRKYRGWRPARKNHKTPSSQGKGGGRKPGIEAREKTAINNARKYKEKGASFSRLQSGGKRNCRYQVTVSRVERKAESKGGGDLGIFAEIRGERENNKERGFKSRQQKSLSSRKKRWIN